MPQIEQSVEINAPIEKVYAIARDVEAFPQFMNDLESLSVVERSADNARTLTTWVGLIRQFKMKIRWTQEDIWNDATHRDDFQMTQGDMDSMSGFWQFTAITPQTTRFESVVNYEYDVPLVGPMIKTLIKKLMTENLQSTLDSIKAKAEE